MAALLKSIARACAAILVLPALCSFWLRRLVLGGDRALQGSSQALSLIPGVAGEYLRRAFLSRVLARCHETTSIEFGVVFSRTAARLDENVYIGPRCHIGLVHIERDSLLASAVQIPSGAHAHGTSDVASPIREQPGTVRLVRIGAGSWIGAGAIVMADVGSGTVVGAGAVVTHPLPDQVIAAGVPARVLKSRG